MKKAMMKWLMLVAAFGLMVTNVAEAAFRVKTPSTAVRQQALMSLQSMGAGDEEAVATTTKENPFSDYHLTLTEEQVRKETARCLGCGASVVDPNRCIGCGICTTKCAFDAIHLFREHPEASVMRTSEDKFSGILPYMVKRAGNILFKKKD